MEVKDAEEYLRELSSKNELNGITIHGGEPLLYYEQLKEIIKEAKKLKIPSRGIITNSFWATSDKQAREILEGLQKAGLNQITISSDSFHQEFIQIMNVKRSIKAASNLGIEKIWVDSYFLGGNKVDSKYNTKTKEILEELQRMKNLQNVEFNNFPITFNGRACTLENNLEKKQTKALADCSLPNWIGGSLANPETIEIDYEGNVTLCPGISIGNAQKQPIMDILENYDVSQHPILSRLYEGGLASLTSLAEEKGFNKEKAYLSSCHLCYEIRKYLRPFYPDYLSPKGCYYGIF